MIGEEFSKHHRTQAHCVEPCLLSPWPSLDIRPSVPASRPLPTPRPLTHCHARAGMRWHAASRTVTDIPLLREREIPVRMSIRARRIASITFLGMPPLTPARALGRMRPAMIRPQRGTDVFCSPGSEARRSPPGWLAMLALPLNTAYRYTKGFTAEEGNRTQIQLRGPN